MTHLKHWLHLTLYNVQVLLCLLTLIAFELQINSHFPHKLHWSILFFIRHRDLYLVFKNSEKINLPISSPIEDDPLRCLKFKTPLTFKQYNLLIFNSYKYFVIPKFWRRQIKMKNLHKLMRNIWLWKNGVIRRNRQIN